MRVIEVESTLESWSIDTINMPALLLYFYFFFLVLQNHFMSLEGFMHICNIA